MPKAFDDDEKTIIRERLLEQGYKQFAAYGLKKTSIDELAAAAGISKGAFYLFFKSKEALFMDVVELAEARYREELLAIVDQPGPSARARLTTIFKAAFTLLKTFPILQHFTSIDYSMLSLRVPVEKLQEHLLNDQAFMQELITHCRAADIPIQARPEQITGLFYMIVLASLHEGEFGPDNLPGTLDLILELIAAFCLGEIEIQTHSVTNLIGKSE